MYQSTGEERAAQRELQLNADQSVHVRTVSEAGKQSPGQEQVGTISQSSLGAWKSSSSTNHSEKP